MIDSQHQSQVAADDSQHQSQVAADGRQGVREMSANGFEDFVPRSLIEREVRAREFIREHPLPVVLGALALGFIAARLFRED